MISTFSSPALVRLAATNAAAFCTSPLFSGSVLMLGILKKSFNSSRKRTSFCWMKVSTAFDMGNFIISWIGAIAQRNPVLQQPDGAGPAAAGEGATGQKVSGLGIVPGGPADRRLV